MEENRFILDTHVWVSIFHKQREEDLIDAIPARQLLFITCDEQLKELEHIVASNNKISKILQSDPRPYLKFISGIAEIRQSRKRFSLLFDYKDNYLVDLAWQSKSILVTDDKGFFPLAKLSAPKVIVISKKKFYQFLGW